MSAATRTGTEGRYVQRFVKQSGLTGETIKAGESAGNVADRFQQARGILAGQEKNIQTLFSTAEELIAGLDTFQQMSKVQQVKNLPGPTKEIRESRGQQLGYVQLTMRFLQSGMLHFMEEMINANAKVENLERLIRQIAEYDQDAPVIGEMIPLDIDTLESYSEVTTPAQIRSDSAAEVSAPKVQGPANRPAGSPAPSNKRGPPTQTKK